MSDVDRFRAAATTFDRRASRQEQLVGEGSQVTREMHATAALLRAMADEQTHVEWMTFTASDGLPAIGRSGTWTAALALAEVILGGDEQIVRTARQWDERGDTVGY